MTKSDLIHQLMMRQEFLKSKDVEQSFNLLLDMMIESLCKGERIEVRGFGSFSLRHRAKKMARNPKTGEKITVPERYRPHFKPGKDLKHRVNKTRENEL